RRIQRNRLGKGAAQQMDRPLAQAPGGAEQATPDPLDEIARLRRALDALEISVRRRPESKPIVREPSAELTDDAKLTGRREWLKGATALAAGVAATALAAATADSAHANVSETTSSSAPTAVYGLSAAPAATTPATPASSSFGVIGVTDSASASTVTSSPPS